MNYDHTPRPHVEEHYHIRELIEAQEKRSADRTDHRERQKASEERASLIASEKWLELKAFYCRKCSKDFYAEEIKQVETDWTNPAQSIAFYKTKHKDCGEWTIRLITDRHKDAYWYKSRAVASDQGRHYADTLQPFQTDYNLMYGKR